MADDDTERRGADDVNADDAGGNDPSADDVGGADASPEDASPDEDTSLGELRAEIEEIDRALVELMAQRTYVAETIAQVKDAEGLPTTDEAQERRVMDRATENADRFDLEPKVIRDVFRLLIELNKSSQRRNRDESADGDQIRDSEG